jgi:heme/copper-type cytochrome/quinol oxidase subunit 2
MRLVILGMGFVFAAGVLAAMFLTFWSTRPAVEREPGLGENLGSKLVWAAIPGLMVLAAATMAVMAIITERAGD